MGTSKELFVRMRKPLLFTLFFFVSSIPTYAVDETTLNEVLEGFDETSQGSGELDAVLEGFDDELQATDNNSNADAAIGEAANWQLSGSLGLSSTYNYAHKAPAAGQTDYRGLSRLRAKLSLELDGKFSPDWHVHVAGHSYYDAAYRIQGRDAYSSDVLDAYERESELGEAFIQGRISKSLDLKIGRQIVVWGKSDNLRVTDVLNPLDVREPGLVDIEDLRLPLTMLKADYYVGDWGLSVIAIPEIRFNKLPAYGSDFFPFLAPLPPEQVPADGFGNAEYAVAANGIFSGWDLSFYWADVYDDNAHSVIAPNGPRLEHSRVDMLGAAVNIAAGNWLLKSEVATFSDLHYAGTHKRRHDLLIGAEYSGFRDTTVSLEVVRRHVTGFDSALAAAGHVENDYQTAFRYTGDFFHDRLELTALATLYGEELDEGGFTRLSAEYDLYDAFTLGGGVVMYREGERTSAIADNDRIFVEMKYSF